MAKTIVFTMVMVKPN